MVCVLILGIPLTASAVSNTEETVSYENGAIRIDDINALPYTVVDVPDQSVATASDIEDTVHYGINQLNPDDFLPLTPTPVNVASDETARNTRASYVRLEFPGAVAGSVYSDFVEHVISGGSSATLNVNICVWAPESNTLEIGIYNWTTAENWYVLKTGGSLSNYAHTFRNLTAGTYSVYIRNHGPNSLTTGYLLYILT